MADPHDQVIPVIEQLQRDFPDRSIRFVTDVPRVGENNKVNSLCRLVKEARYGLLVMTDSDVRVPRDYLREVVAPFADRRVGAVTCFYRCAGGGTLAANLDMLGMCMDSVPSALLARQLEGNVQFAFGWTMAHNQRTAGRNRRLGGNGQSSFRRFRAGKSHRFQGASRRVDAGTGGNGFSGRGIH